MSFDAEVERALAQIGAAPDDALIDGALDPAGGAEALRAAAEEGRALLLRAHAELGRAVKGYGPVPEDAVLLRATSESEGESRGREVRLVRVALRGGDPRDAQAKRVVIERARIPCCTSPSCSLEREAITAHLELDDGERLVVAEGRPFRGQPDDGAEEFARALATLLDVPLGGEGDARAERAKEMNEAPSAPVGERGKGPASARATSARKLAQFAMRAESDVLVLRDAASDGPRAMARKNRLVSVALAIVALGLWAVTVSLSRATEGLRAVEVGAAAMLVSITAYAFHGVASFAARYAARSAPLALFGRGSFVVAPWVARGGAVDLRPEGRLGAAIPSNEVRAVVVAPRDANFAIVIESDHGAIDAVELADADVAEVLAAAVRRGVELSKHPATGPSARQRARENQRRA